MEILGVTDRLSEVLRDRIVSGELPPGTRLNEAALANEFGVSRAPVREALRVLNAKKLVVRNPRRGTHVATLSVEELEALYQARQMMEPFAVQLLELQGKRDLPLSESALEKAKSMSAPPLDDKSAMLNYLYCFSDFHVGLVKEAGNKWLTEFYETITYNLARYQFICLYIPGVVQDSLGMHQHILKRIKNGEYRQAQDLLLKHIDVATEAVKNSLKQSKYILI